MGNKTFGATGTNTVVLFLEKYNEPPKKADLIEDSIDAVFNGCNLDGAKDKAIFGNSIWKKIDVAFWKSMNGSYQKRLISAI